MDLVGTQVVPGREGSSTHTGWLRPRRLLVIFDAVAMMAALLTVRYLLGMKGLRERALFESSYIMLGVFVAVTLLLIFRDGQYSVGYRMSRLADVANLVKNLLIGMAVAVVLYFLTKGYFTDPRFLSRVVVFGAMGVFFVVAAVSRVGLATYQRSLFNRGKSVKNVLILGTGKASDELLARFEQHPWLGVRCAGRLVYGSRPVEGKAIPTDVICVTDTMEGLEDLDRSMRVSGASTVLVALDEHEHGVLPNVIRLLTLAHVEYKILPSLFESSYAVSSRMECADLPSVLQFRVDPLDRAQLMFKRILDVCVAILLMVFILPLTAVLSLLIKVDSPGPVFYKQERVGRNGRGFAMYKFRTMVTNAEALLEELADKNEAEAGNGEMFKMRNDPRITRVGRFLRKWSLDELPQMFNVLKGEMSLVGPRPPLPREVEKYEPEHLCRLKGMPGLTGLWQVSGRSELSFEEMVRLDNYYLENWSILLDLSILVKTPYVMLMGKGAY